MFDSSNIYGQEKAIQILLAYDLYPLSKDIIQLIKADLSVNQWLRR